MTEYAILEEVRAYAKIQEDDSAGLDVLQDLLGQVSRLIDTLTGRILVPAEDTEVFVDFCNIEGRDLWIGERNNPLLSITSLLNGNGTSIASSEYLLLPRGASRSHTIRLKEMSNVDWEEDPNGDSFIKITGKWGWSLTVPDDLRLETIEAIVYIYKQRDVIENSERAQVSPDGFVVLPAMLPKRTQLWIDKHKVKV